MHTRRLAQAVCVCVCVMHTRRLAQALSQLLLLEVLDVEDLGELLRLGLAHLRGRRAAEEHRHLWGGARVITRACDIGAAEMLEYWHIDIGCVGVCMYVRVCVGR